MQSLATNWRGVAVLAIFVVAALVAVFLGEETLAALFGGAAVGNLTPSALTRKPGGSIPPPDSDDEPTNPGKRIQ